MYKYSCRKCPIRNRCIQESDTSPSAKEMIRNAFSAKTDTLATWGVLQKNCLLVKAEQRRAKLATEESLLSRRLREVREAKNKQAKQNNQSTDTPEYLKPVRPLKPLKSKSSPLGKPSNSTQAPRTREQAISRPSAPPPKPQAASGRPCWLTISSSKRHISLPKSGELVLGRFDPHLGLPPDIDLAYEDGNNNTVSRRHAKIVGFNGRHSIEDLGSRNGLVINGQPVPSGPPRQLKPGDRIMIGDVSLVYDVIPVSLLDINFGTNDKHTLKVAATGQTFELSPPKEIVIGRSDRFVDFLPDIDLSDQRDVAMRVSRRHALITWRAASPYVEDLGSGFGTRLNGEALLIGQPVALKPGDHIWLAGCVLAYDIAI